MGIRMATPSSKVRRAAHAAKVAARSAHISGVAKCYVEQFENAAGRPDLRLREKSTKRIVRILTGNPMLRDISPLRNLLLDCYSHGGGLVEPQGRREDIAIAATIVKQTAEEIHVLFDLGFSVKINIDAVGVASPPTSVWAYIEEYSTDDGNRGLRLRQKATGRKIEMYGKNQDHLLTFLASPIFTGANEAMPNLFEKDGFNDYVLVSGGTATDSFDVLLFDDGPELTYLLGPTPDTAYRDAFRALAEESAPESHARTAQAHFDSGRYREAVLSARLAVEMACGGDGAAVKRSLANAPSDVAIAGAGLFAHRNVAVHEGGTRVEQPDALKAIRLMHQILIYLVSEST